MCESILLDDPMEVEIADDPFTWGTQSRRSFAPDEQPQQTTLKNPSNLKYQTEDDVVVLVTESTPAVVLANTSRTYGPSPTQHRPPFNQRKSAAFIPPARPSSTPFPFSDPDTSRLREATSLDSENQTCLSGATSTSVGQETPVAPWSCRHSHFTSLPAEVHEAILDHLFGYRVSTTSSSAMAISSANNRSWATALRHSRRKELTELSLVSPLWRDLIQQRLYRHIKLKATVDSLTQAMLHFIGARHLKPYVKHIELWFPVFHPTYRPRVPTNSLTLPTVTLDGLTNATYTLPTNNCSLMEAFTFVEATVPDVQILTLEGGERRKAPKVQHFSRRDCIRQGVSPKFPVLRQIRTLVTRGQWNLMRDNDDFIRVLNAVPNLVEWQSSYSRPKSKSYLSTADFFPHLPPTISNLNLTLESDYRREGMMPIFYSKVLADTHFCASMGRMFGSLEHFAYTGRICKYAFTEVMRLADPRVTRLKSIDITVKNCCRPMTSIHESGSGINNAAFIDAFEELVLAGVRSLGRLKKVEYLRVRFVDLDFCLPHLNPFFLLHNDTCTGVWSEAIIDEMARVRPTAHFPTLSDSFGSIGCSKDGVVTIAPEFPRTKVTSLKLSNYRQLANRITIH